jgi:hypothetical protein
LLGRIGRCFGAFDGKRRRLAHGAGLVASVHSHCKIGTHSRFKCCPQRGLIGSQRLTAARVRQRNAFAPDFCARKALKNITVTTTTQARPGQHSSAGHSSTTKERSAS